MKKLFLLLLFLVVRSATGQPVTINFVKGPDKETEMTAVTSVLVITKAGPFNFREIRLMTFTQSMPDSSSLKKLRDFGIEVLFKPKPVKQKPIKPVVVEPVESRQQVTITFKNRSGLSTEWTAVTPAQVVTQDGPFNPREIRRMKFAGTVPDSTLLQQLRDLGIEVLVMPPGSSRRSKSAFGIGLGLDYGGIGGKFTLLSGRTLSMFGGVGYNLDKVGYNAGFEINFDAKKRTTPFFSAMYGYNLVVERYNPYAYDNTKTTYYGPSIGFGLKARPKSRKNYFSFQIIYAIKIGSARGLKSDSPIDPLLFSLGYNFE